MTQLTLPSPCFAACSAFVAMIVGMAGCASSPDIEEAPLADARQKKLRETLVGTWERTHTVRDGERNPAEEPVETWTFDKNGTARRGTSQTSDGESTGTFDWELDGRNIVLEPKGSGSTRYFRAESWSPQQLRWHSYGNGVTLILRRASSGPKAPGTTGGERRTPRRQ